MYLWLFSKIINNNNPVIRYRQILDLVPIRIFESCTKTYKTDKGVSKYKTFDQFDTLTFGQFKKVRYKLSAPSRSKKLLSNNSYYASYRLISIKQINSIYITTNRDGIPIISTIPKAFYSFGLV